MGAMSCQKKTQKLMQTKVCQVLVKQDDTTPKFHLFWSLWTLPHWIRIIPARLNRCRSQRSDSCAWACLSCRWHLWRSVATWSWRCAAGGRWELELTKIWHGELNFWFAKLGDHECFFGWDVISFLGRASTRKNIEPCLDKPTSIRGVWDSQIMKRLNNIQKPLVLRFNENSNTG